MALGGLTGHNFGFYRSLNGAHEGIGAQLEVLGDLLQLQRHKKQRLDKSVNRNNSRWIAPVLFWNVAKTPRSLGGGHEGIEAQLKVLGDLL